MSMLSAQCDELRERAATLRQGRWSDGADDARLMEDAAETILSLRDRAQDLQAKNAKLRELCVKALEWLRWAGGITCPPEVPDEFADELRELGIEELDA